MEIKISIIKLNKHSKTKISIIVCFSLVPPNITKLIKAQPQINLIVCCKVHRNLWVVD